MGTQKKILAVHDISCVGKCSLTVALPILSAAGASVGVIPTAVLSTHTGGFTGYTCRDLTGDIPHIVRHWKSLGLRFDAIYTGYLASSRQLAVVSRLIEDFRGPDTLVCVDPVMADNGRLYAAFGPDFPAGMVGLCRRADLIVPNRTEAALLLGEPYRGGVMEPEEAGRIARRLSELGPPKVVLTGVRFGGERVGCAVFDRKTGTTGFALSRRVEGTYCGTGDVFASALLGALSHGFSLFGAAHAAVDFTAGAIARTRAAGTDVRFGVDFEEGLPAYARLLEDGPRTGESETGGAGENQKNRPD